MRALEKDTLVDWRDEAPFDAVAVLGGGTDQGVVRGQPELSTSGDRVMLGARLYHRGQTPILVTSGSNDTRTHDRSAETAAIWQDVGIPSQSIIRVPEPINTKQEVAALKELAEARGWQRIGLVTSAWHMGRTLSFCERIGLEVIPLPADHHSFGMHFPSKAATMLIPRGEGFDDLEIATREIVAAMVR
jgi:uncharacterized SAM-binding protein YcdF (DUF218 family)